MGCMNLFKKTQCMGLMLYILMNILDKACETDSIITQLSQVAALCLYHNDNDTVPLETKGLN